MLNILHKILDELENNLDKKHLNVVKERHRKTIDYENVDHPPVKILYPASKMKPYPYIEAFNNMGKMMFNELVSPKAIKPIYEGTFIYDDTIPMLRANYGVGIMPSIFNVECVILANNLPWVTPLNETKKIKELINRGVPDIKSGLGGRVLETYEFYAEQLEKYPLCRDCIVFFHPDIQGPFDIAHLIWGSEIYYAVYDEPETIHELLELITETYILYLKEIKDLINDTRSGCLFHWGSYYKGGMLIRNDTAVNISKDMYEEFVRPYDERIFEAFGGGSIHYCGRGDQWISSMFECKGLQALNNGQPPNLEFGIKFLRSIYGDARKRKIALIDYIIDTSELSKELFAEFPTGVSFKIAVSDREKANSVMEKLNDIYSS